MVANSCWTLSGEVSNGTQANLAQPDKPAEPVLDIHENERAAIRRALEQAGGNRTRAAEILGISRRTLQRKLKQEPELEENLPSGQK